MRGKKLTIVLSAILVALIGFVSGTIFWTLSKTSNVFRSVKKATLSIQAHTTASASQSPSVVETKLNAPGIDVAGEDLKDVPRYPSSIRSQFEKGEDGTVINQEYFVDAEVETIFTFYKETLPDNGWFLYAQDEKSLAFSAQGKDLTLNVEARDSLSHLVKYSFHYFEK